TWDGRDRAVVGIVGQPLRLPRLAGEPPSLQKIQDIRAIVGSVLLSSAQICVICGNFGCNEAQIEKEWRYAQSETRPESCPQRCARNIEKPNSGIRAAHSAHKVGEIHFCDFSAPDVRGSYTDIFHGVRARDCYAAIVGGRRVLVLLVRRGAVANSLLRSAAPNLDLRVRARAYARALGIVDGWSRESVPRWPRR